MLQVHTHWEDRLLLKLKQGVHWPKVMQQTLTGLWILMVRTMHNQAHRLKACLAAAAAAHSSQQQLLDHSFD